MILRRTLCILLLLGCASSASAQRPTAHSGALLSVQEMSAWSAGVRGKLDKRELRSGNTLIELSAVHVVGQLGCSPAPFVFFFGEMGVSRADVTLDNVMSEGEYGLEWSVGARAQALECVISSSPSLARKNIVSFGTEVIYTASRSNAGSIDFSWSEYQVVFPSISYFLDRRAEVSRQPYEELAIGADLGFVFSRVSGNFGALSLRENRDLGLKIGADIWLSGGWTVEFDGCFFTSADRSAGLSVVYHF